MLPKIPSELLSVALADLEKAEADSHYSIHLLGWHRPVGELCQVCLAGAVMAFSLGADIHRDLSPADFPCTRELIALNFLCFGIVDKALEVLGVANPTRIRQVSIVHYEVDPDLFKRDIVNLITRLQAAGI